MPFLVPILLVLLAFAILLRADLLFATVWFLAGIYLVSRLWSRYAARHLMVWRRFTNHAFVGDVVEVELGVRNDSRLPLPWVEVEESVPLELRDQRFPAHAIVLGPGAERRFTYRLTCKRRGYYGIGPMRVQSGELLGIDEQHLSALEPTRLTVYPRLVTLDTLGLPTRSALVALPAPTPLFEDPSRMVGVRDYRPGDSTRRMHWGATARLGRLMVKQFQPAIARETLICLNLNIRDYDVWQRFTATEMAIVVTASLAHHIIRREHLPAGLVALGRDVAFPERTVSLFPRAEQSHLMAILEALARIESVSEGDASALVREAIARLQWGSTIVVVTGRLTDDLASTLVQAKRRGHAAAAIVIQPRPGSGATASGVGAVPANILGTIRVHRVWADEELARL